MKTDLNYLKTMSGNSPVLISEMIDIFSGQVEEFHSEMQKLYNDKDYEALGKLAHKAKTSVSIMGMNNLAEKMKELEILARDRKKTETYKGIIDFFRSECDEALRELIDFQNQIS